MECSRPEAVLKHISAAYAGGAPDGACDVCAWPGQGLRSSCNCFLSMHGSAVLRHLRCMANLVLALMLQVTALTRQAMERSMCALTLSLYD